MKKFYLLLAVSCGFLTASSQTLFTYGNHKVAKDEFLRAYNKNKTPVEDREKSLRDYLSLYSNFKLKVRAALDLRMDTLPQLQTDLENFRKQIAENYLNDDKGMKFLVDQAFQRSQQDIRVSLLTIPVDKQASPRDTMQAYQTAQALYQHLKSGKAIESFEAGQTAPVWKDLGYVTAFTLPYQYENIVYSLSLGEASQPYRSKNGWVIFKATDRRPGMGKWKIAQILFTYPPGADDNVKLQVAREADSVYRLLANGANFAELARGFSDDKLTYLAGGEMPEFGTGKFDHAFEKEVMNLKNNGDISKPFSTSFGIHIIKRISHAETVSDKNDASFQYELNQKVMQDSRVSIAKEKFSKDIRSKIGFKKSAAIKDADLFRYADSVMVHPEEGYVNSLPLSKKPVISFTKSSVTMGDWLNFASMYKSNADQYKGETNQALWEKFVSISSIEYYQNHLEEYSDDFRYQMEEFRDGNMLFEIMERNVWSKASADNEGLLDYYNKHKENYTWAASADVLIINCISEKAAEDAKASLNAGMNWKDLATERNYEVQIDSGRYELSQLSGVNEAVFPGKKVYSPVIRNTDGTATFFQYLNGYGPNEQKGFDDARGLVINDYQMVLEQKWLDELKKKYPVKVNDAVFATMLK